MRFWRCVGEFFCVSVYSVHQTEMVVGPFAFSLSPSPAGWMRIIKIGG